MPDADLPCPEANLTVGDGFGFLALGRCSSNLIVSPKIQFTLFSWALMVSNDRLSIRKKTNELAEPLGRIFLNVLQSFRVQVLVHLGNAIEDLFLCFLCRDIGYCTNYNQLWLELKRRVLRKNRQRSVNARYRSGFDDL